MTFEQLETIEIPMTVRWEIDGRFGTSKEMWLVGIEWPADEKHMRHVAGNQVFDNGEWRKLKHVAMPLPTTVEQGMTLRHEPAEEVPVG